MFPNHQPEELSLKFWRIRFHHFPLQMALLLRRRVFFGLPGRIRFRAELERSMDRIHGSIPGPVNVDITNWKDPTIFHGKINYFDWAMFKFANCKRLPEGIAPKKIEPTTNKVSYCWSHCISLEPPLSLIETVVIIN